MGDITDRGPDASGRFLLRIPPGLHEALRRAAQDAGLSLNEYCARKLAAPARAVQGPAVDVVTRAAEQFGEDLVGVLVFGSWARGEATDTSDVDILIVVDPRVRVVRSLYRPWDEAGEALTWNGCRLEIHLVNLPDTAEPPGSLWAEAALEGIVLYDRGFELARCLMAFRQGIAAGVVRRRSVQGQPYWVGAN